MIIWFALIIPIITAFVLMYFFPKQMAWWEYFIPFAASLLLITIGKSLVDTYSVVDTEYWGGWITRANYFEDWDERVPCRHPIYITVSHTGINSDGTTYTYTTTEYAGNEHSYDVDYHPEYYEVEDSNGVSFRITNDEYRKFCQIFGNEKFEELNRNVHSNDGDVYHTVWNGNEDALQPTTVIHTYSNKVAVSRSIYSYPIVDKKKVSVYEYPEPEGWLLHSVLSSSPWKDSFLIDNINATLGASKEVRVWVLVFDNKPIQASFDQEAYWKGSNKNELVICVGVHGKQVDWCRVFSWSKSEELKSSIQYYLASDKKELNFTDFAPFLKKEIQTKWVRRRWEDFDYLTVEPSGASVFWIWFLTILISVGSGVYCVQNEINSVEDL